MKIILVCILSFLLAFNLFSADKKTYSEEYVVREKSKKGSRFVIMLRI